MSQSLISPQRSNLVIEAYPAPRTRHLVSCKSPLCPCHIHGQVCLPIAIGTLALYQVRRPFAIAAYRFVDVLRSRRSDGMCIALIALRAQSATCTIDDGLSGPRLEDSYHEAKARLQSSERTNERK
eukprot:TRINITY_DN12633_c0_g1_i11.p1 TRINITY_DN12633_c0_g1~~TRINITY_DN12633_c0_g1_i11.p1  ORF type:complete len:145 (+),score=0.71 TRINITY_DN12633_c0_g1_i11:60-437(+)